MQGLYLVQGRIQADAWKLGLQHDFFKYGLSPGLSEKKNMKNKYFKLKKCVGLQHYTFPGYAPASFIIFAPKHRF